ncbi:unnamed protein product [Prorocentrum cordatum]|uniref:Uncharacterized protein n=1 Tax=Prorocentrum cordatum TaxID=2364126 RepID=A0ABN9Y9X9_9DINO|nr:unnamed protein product [Polarella glacialis]
MDREFSAAVPGHLRVVTLRVVERACPVRRGASEHAPQACRPGGRATRRRSEVLRPGPGPRRRGGTGLRPRAGGRPWLSTSAGGRPGCHCRRRSPSARGALCVPAGRSPASRFRRSSARAKWVRTRLGRPKFLPVGRAAGRAGRPTECGRGVGRGSLRAGPGRRRRRREARAPTRARSYSRFAVLVPSPPPPRPPFLPLGGRRTSAKLLALRGARSAELGALGVRPRGGSRLPARGPRPQAEEESGGCQLKSLGDARVAGLEVGTNTNIGGVPPLGKNVPISVMVATFWLPRWPKYYHNHRDLGSSSPCGGNPSVLVLVLISRPPVGGAACALPCPTRSVWALVGGHCWFGPFWRGGSAGAGVQD